MEKKAVTELKNRIKELEKIIKFQEAEIKKISALSERDSLTELYNRRGFIREAEKFLAEVRVSIKIKQKRRIHFKDFSIIFIDIDKLKVINDKLGHKAGDRALKAAANLFKHSVRDLDVVARWGGDEFIVGLAGANEETAFKTAEKLRKKLRAIKMNGDNLTASFGIVSYHHKNIVNRLSPEFSEKYKNKEKILGQLYELIEKADMTMYEAKKKKGSNPIVIYNNESII